MGERRFQLMRDEDAHWYLIPVDREQEFRRLEGDPGADGAFGAFIDVFDTCRIDGPHRLTFTDPKVG